MKHVQDTRGKSLQILLEILTDTEVYIEKHWTLPYRLKIFVDIGTFYRN